MPGKDRREAILAAARQMAQTAGAGRVRMEDVARAAGVSVPALYRYYASKDELLSAALERSVSARADLADARREEIMAAALRLFARKGFQATTIAEIGEAVQISQAAIYRWFTSKEEILACVIERYLSPLPVLGQAGGEAWRGEDPPGGDARADLHRLGLALVSAFRANQELWRFVFSEGMNNPDAADLIYNKLFVETASQLARHLQRFMDAGALAPADPELAARACLGLPLVYMIIRHLFGERGARLPLTDEEVATALLDLLWQGLRAR